MTDDDVQQAAMRMLLAAWTRTYGEDVVGRLVAHYGGEQLLCAHFLDYQRDALNEAGLREVARNIDPHDRNLIAAVGPVMFQAQVRLFSEAFGEDEGRRLHNEAMEKQYEEGAEPAW